MIEKHPQFPPKPVCDYIVTLYFKGCSPLSHPQMKITPGFRRVSCFHNPVWDYILTLHFKGCSPLSHAQKNTPHGFPEGVSLS
jgi:hypothetical protein